MVKGTGNGSPGTCQLGEFLGYLTTTFKMQNLWWIIIFITILSSEFLHTEQTQKASLKNFVEFHNKYNKLKNHDLEFLNWQSLRDTETNLREMWKILDAYYDYLLIENNNIEIFPKNLSSSAPNLELLNIANNRIQKIEEGTFNNLNSLMALNIEGNKLPELSTNIFSNLNSLTYLSIRKNNLTTLPKGIFGHNYNLTIIDLSQNLFETLPKGLFKKNQNLIKVYIRDAHKLTSLPSGLFSNLKFLSKVNISNCNLKNLPENLFERSISLTGISLAKNALQTLPAKIFSGLRSLLLLNLSYNQIITLPDDLFKHCPHLQEIKLNNNNIKTINWSIFKRLHFLIRIHLNHNKIENIVGDPIPLVTVSNINLSHNNITDSNSNSSDFLQSVFNIFPRLGLLDLSYNKLQSALKNWTKRLPPNFHSLDLAHNAITSLSGDDLNIQSQRDFKLDLSKNNITEIDLQNYNENRYKIVLNVENNPLKCNCHLYDVLRYSNNSLNKLEEQKLSILTGSTKCFDSNEYENVLLSTINFEEYKCIPSEEEIVDYSMCPQMCDLRKRFSDITLLVDCANRNLTHAPETLCFLKYPNSSVELNLTGNQIKEFPSFQQVGYHKITSLLLSHNQISTISKEAFSNTTLKKLALNNNQLRTLSADVIKKISTDVQSIHLGNNSWKCNHEASHFQKFLLTENTVEDADSVNCENSKLLLKDINIDYSRSLGKFLFIVIGTIICVFALLFYYYRKEIKFWLYIKNCCLWFATEEEVDKDKLYDAFISYSHKDEAFVINELVTTLEKGPESFKLCLHFRDWLAGMLIPTQIVKSIQNSRRTIIVLSPNFIKSDWGKLEFKTAYKQGLEEGKTRLIVILYGKIGSLDKLDLDLQNFLKTNTCIRWGDSFFWNKLRFAMPHKSYVLPPISMATLMDRSDLV